jgi:HNH endonuclease
MSPLTLTKFLGQINMTDPDNCWDWIGAVDGAGYGTITVHYKQLSVHRVVYQLFRGGIPDGMCVCHRCDNKLCANPIHLYLGTVADNNRHACESGLRRRYKRVGHIEAGKILTSDKSNRALAEKLGRSQATIARVRSINNPVSSSGCDTG